MSTVDNMNCFEILGVEEGATTEEITAAYKKLALKWHPDRRLNDQENATKKFVEINDAYRALLNERRGRSKSTSSSDSRSRSRSSSRTPSNDSCPDFENRSTSSFTTFESDSCVGEDDTAQDEYMRNPSMNRSTSNISSSSSWTRVDESACGYEPHPDDEPPLKKSAHDLKDRHFNSKFRNPFRHGTTRPPIPACSSTGTCDTGQQKSGYNPRRVPTITPCKQTSSKEWKYNLKLTLEELFHGKKCRFRLDRYLQSGVKRRIVINIDVPPGCAPGTRIVCAGAGHEHKDGSFQDIVFVVDEESHDMFYRVVDDLVMEVTLPWDSNLEKDEGTVRFRGLDGELLTIKIDYRKERSLKGCNVIFGAGMTAKGEPSRRGDLFVRWQIEPPSLPKWQSFKKIFHRQ
ncbi:DnaJ-domain-containing protein [Pleurotus eryngii]|uniref:DnaJ-domain-containing protein n=1 Tax=Pleurotus eryngii TaxID=5323 RepID=A0A9P5ZRI6_PLEER|nr:DnaJ-domain-containing protein [Pleurotus eryngii]